jgi:hypothetical protein
VVVVLILLLLLVGGAMYYKKHQRDKMYPPHGQGTNNPVYDINTGTSAGASSTGPRTGGAIYVAPTDPAYVIVPPPICIPY